ncbi:MAG: histidine phosphatase family protein, partial [Pseudomonadota bacterium]
MRLLSIGSVMALVVGLAPACAQPSTADPLEVYIVRHAEKIRTGDSSIDNNCAPGPRLTDEGFARAMDLRELFADADIDGVFSTNCRRTIQTGILVASDHGEDSTRPSANDDSYAPITLYDAPETLARANPSSVK